MKLTRLICKMVSARKSFFLAFCLSTLVVVIKLWDLKYVHGYLNVGEFQKRTVIKTEKKTELKKSMDFDGHLSKSTKRFTGLRKQWRYIGRNSKHNGSLLNSTVIETSATESTSGMSSTTTTVTTTVATIPTTALPSTAAKLIDDLPPPIIDVLTPTVAKSLPRECIGVNRSDEKLQWSVQPKDCQGDTYIVWLIKSSIYRNHLRRFIRQTWAKDDVPLAKGGKTFYIRRIFLVGSEPDNHIIPYIQKEIKTYGDILQGTFVDTPQSITQKVLLGMRFVKDKCPQVKITIVADDEAVFAPWNMIILLSSVMDTEKLYGGFSFGRLKPIRDKNSPWYISEKDYHCTDYPLYSIRTVYFMSKQTLEQMYYSGTSYQLFPIDDVLFGGLAEELGVERKFFNNLHYSDCQQIMDPHPSVVLKEQVVCHGGVMPNNQGLAWEKLCQAPVIRPEAVDVNIAYCESSVKSPDILQSAL